MILKWIEVNPHSANLPRPLIIYPNESDKWWILWRAAILPCYPLVSSPYLVAWQLVWRLQWHSSQLLFESPPGFHTSQGCKPWRSNSTIKLYVDYIVYRLLQNAGSVGECEDYILNCFNWKATYVQLNWYGSFFGDKAKQGGCICVVIKSKIIQEEIHFFCSFGDAGERGGCMCVVIPMACASSPSAPLVKTFVGRQRCARYGSILHAAAPAAAGQKIIPVKILLQLH